MVNQITIIFHEAVIENVQITIDRVNWDLNQLGTNQVLGFRRSVYTIQGVR